MSFLRRLRTALKEAAGKVWNVICRTATRLAGWVRAAQTALRTATVRHRERVQDDGAYARSISTAVAELVTTMVPRPTLATTLAVALSGLLSHPPEEPPRHTSSRVRDDYPSYGRSAVPPAVPGSLWDRLT